MSASYSNITRCINGVREEFERQPNAIQSETTRRFNIYLTNLGGEFELMSLELKSLRKERDDCKTKIEMQAKELQNIVRRDTVCERCSKTTTNVPISKTASINTTTPALFSRLFSQFQFQKRRVQSHASQGVELAQQNIHRSTQSHSRTVDPLPSSQQPDSELDEHNWSIIFNSEAEKQLDVEHVRLLSHTGRIYCVRFSPDQKNIAVGCTDGKIYIYDLDSGKLACVLRNLLNESDSIRAICFSRDGKHLATSMSNHDIYVWEMSTRYVRNAFKGHTHAVISLDFSPNGRLLVSSSNDNTVRLWNMRSGTSKFLTEESPTFLADPCYTRSVFSPDGKYVAASHSDGIVRIWDVRARRLMRRVNVQRRWVADVGFMPDGNGLICAGVDRTLKFWDIGSLGTTRLDHLGEEQTEPEREFKGHKQAVFCLSISPDGKWIVSGSLDKSVRIWNVSNATMECVLGNVHDDVLCVDFSASGCYFASGGRDGKVRLWRCLDVTM